MRSITYNWW